MSLLRRNVFLLIVMFVGSRAALGCTSKRAILGNCDCHFLGGCDWSKTPPVPSATPSAAHPVGINAFAKNPSTPQTTTICEGKLNSLGVLYDCDLRIPLYSARALGDADITALYLSKYDRSDFSESRYLNPRDRQKNGDYRPEALDQIPCYESFACKSGIICPEPNWVKKSRAGALSKNCDKKLMKEEKKIHKGHLIAASYGRSATSMRQSVKDTFTLSNAVPQFKDLNSGLWNQNEKKLLIWANNNCASTAPNRRNGRLFIVVGRY